MKRTPLSRGPTLTEDGRRRYSTFQAPASGLARSPLARGRIKRKPARRIAKRLAMRPYVAFIHTLPCCCEVGVYRWQGQISTDVAQDGIRISCMPSGYRESMCSGRIEANHAGPKPGVGLKAPDSTCIPMCHRHHSDWTDHRGLFAGWTKDERRAWADEQIRATRLLAIPESREAAYEFERLGLGTVLKETLGQGWAWLPLAEAAA